MKERKTKIVFPVFGDYTIHVVVSDDVCESRKKRDGYFGESFEGTARALHSYSLTRPAESWLFLHGLAKPGSIAHESWHAVYRMMDWAGARIENEIVAYHLDYLVDKVWKHVRPKGYR